MGVATVEGFKKDVGSKYTCLEVHHDKLRQHNNRKRQNTQHYP
jgi:hypothetical protein